MTASVCEHITVVRVHSDQVLIACFGLGGDVDRHATKLNLWQVSHYQVTQQLS